MAKIIIVDDNENMRRVLMDALGRNHELLEAKGGAEGIALGLEHRDADLIILDIVMPEIDGRQVFAQLRQHRVQTPVLLLTSETNTSTISYFLASGVAGYLSKAGFSNSAFRAQVEGIIKKTVLTVPKADRVYRQGPKRDNATVSVLYIGRSEADSHTFGDLLARDVFLVGVANTDAPIAFCAHSRFDLVVVDTSMPAIDPEALLELLRVLQPATPIISIVQNTPTEHDGSTSTSSIGFDSELCRPLKQTTIHRLIEIQKKCLQSMKTYGSIIQIDTTLRSPDIGPGRLRHRLPQLLEAAMTRVAAQGGDTITIDLGPGVPIELAPCLVDTAHSRAAASGLRLQVGALPHTSALLARIPRFRKIDLVTTAA